MKKSSQRNPRPITHYSAFDEIDGSHPLQKLVPESVVLYRARERKQAKIRHFNFSLAKEMDLIARDHPHEMNEELQAKILETFSLVIINEYDLEQNKKFPRAEVRRNFFMATRYLQLQHPNKQGKTSGDGRCIWNGTWTDNKGVTWDLSSSGTGATRLSPARAIYQKNFQTGDPSISYGCGYSEIDEALATLLFSEVLHKNGISTERILALIEFPGGYSISVRAHPNLLRPSHFFTHIKQSNLDPLKRLVEYQLNKWKQFGHSDLQTDSLSEHDGLEYFLGQLVQDFAKACADFEDNYIFCWMDWDGDNILMDGGIIDYGSVRQFGLFHHHYRYDDIERYSTTILEQKKKCRYMLQTFVQGVDFIRRGKKRAISHFANCSYLKTFDDQFERYKDENLLQQLGLPRNLQVSCLNKHRRLIRDLRKLVSYFQRQATAQGYEKTADGINKKAIYNVKQLLRVLPEIYQDNWGLIAGESFQELMKTDQARASDYKLSSYRKTQMREFQRNYMKLIDAVVSSDGRSKDSLLMEISTRVSIMHKQNGLTGDAVTHIVDYLLRRRPKLSVEEIDQILGLLIQNQNRVPERRLTDSAAKLENLDPKIQKIFHKILSIIHDFREGL